MGPLGRGLDSQTFHAVCGMGAGEPLPSALVFGELIMKRKLGRGVAVVGVGKSQFGMFADRELQGLVCRGIHPDAGLGR